jgi:hypothetical protein
MGKYSRFWEMREGSKKHAVDVFKCTGCGAVTNHPLGHNGEPDVHRCHPGCPVHASDWRPGERDADYRKNFDRIFPAAPGAGV